LGAGVLFTANLLTAYKQVPSQSLTRKLHNCQHEKDPTMIKLDGWVVVQSDRELEDVIHLCDMILATIDFSIGNPTTVNKSTTFSAIQPALMELSISSQYVTF